MDGDLAPVNELAAVARQHDAWLMIDDAHGLGVLGKHGGGLLESCAASLQDVPILMGTLGKALGTFGAFVAGETDLIETLIQKARSYIYTTALPQAVASATLASLALLDSDGWRRDKLRENIACFRQLAAQAGLQVVDSQSVIQPVLIGDVALTLHLSRTLQAEGLLVVAIRPPTVPQGTARLRITLSALHTQPQIERLVTVLAQALLRSKTDNE